MRSRKIDKNQPALVQAMRKIGLSVHVTSMLGNGFPDLVAGYQGNNYLFEVKDPAQMPSKRRLTEDEQRFFDTWKGKVYKVESIEDVVKAVNDSQHPQSGPKQIVST